MKSIADLTFNLTEHQSQVLSHLAIDAWYLTPWQQSDPDYAQNQSAISGIVDSLTQTLHSESTDSQKSIEAAVAATTVEQVVTDLPPSQVETAAANKTVAANQSSSQLRSGQTLSDLKPIVLDDKAVLTPPSEMLVTFPVSESSLKVDKSWQGIKQALEALSAAKAQGSLSASYLGGAGDENAETLLVLPPLAEAQLTQQDLLTADERQLLTETLRAIRLDIEQVYMTPLTKQPMLNELDPDATMLSQHLPLLQAEISLVRPQRLIVFGQVAAQALLQTAAPLSALMGKTYQLDWAGGVSCSVHCLPEISYYLNLPAEKATLWQTIKTL